MAEDTTRGVHLNEKQLVFVLMAAGVICGVMFLFGVLVGRGLQAPSSPIAGVTMMTPPQVVSDATPASEAGAEGTGRASGPDTFTYPNTLAQPVAGVEPSKAAPPGPATSAAAGNGAAAAPPPVVEEAPPVPDVPADPPKAATAEAAGTGTISVQVSFVKKRAEADAIVRKLKARGYQAFVFVPDPSDKTGGFRVRIGPYKTRHEADVIARKIESEGQYKTWITR